MENLQGMLSEHGDAPTYKPSMTQHGRSSGEAAEELRRRCRRSRIAFAFIASVAWNLSAPSCTSSTVLGKHPYTVTE